MTYLRCTWHEAGQRCPKSAAVSDGPPHRVLCTRHAAQLAIEVQRHERDAVEQRAAHVRTGAAA